MQLLECAGKGVHITEEITAKTRENIIPVEVQSTTHIPVTLPQVVHVLEECFPHKHRVVPRQVEPILPHFEVQKDASANI
jgi:hypothetical protein